LGVKIKNIFAIFVGICNCGTPIGYLIFFFKFFEYVIFENSELVPFNHKLLYITIVLYIIIPTIILNKFS